MPRHAAGVSLWRFHRLAMAPAAASHRRLAACSKCSAAACSAAWVPAAALTAAQCPCRRCGPRPPSSEGAPRSSAAQRGVSSGAAGPARLGGRCRPGGSGWRGWARRQRRHANCPVHRSPAQLSAGLRAPGGALPAGHPEAGVLPGCPAPLPGVSHRSWLDAGPAACACRPPGAPPAAIMPL